MEIIKILLPVLWISILAITTIHIAKKNSKKYNDKGKQISENHMSEGVAIGICLGSAVGALIDIEHIAFWASIGMALGMVFGMHYKK